MQQTEGKSSRLSYIDVLRCVAILGVILVHCAQYGSGELGIPIFFTNIIHDGDRGVQLFFLMSAFTIWMTFSRHKLCEKKASSNFYIRRFFRIAPMFYLAMAYYLVEDGVRSGISMWNIVATTFFAHGISPYWINSVVPGGWTIAVEMSFYVGVPLMVKFVKDIKSATLVLLGSVLLKAVLQKIFEAHMLIPSRELWNDYLFQYFPGQIPIFMMGIILYYIFIDGKTAIATLFAIITPMLLLEKINAVTFVDVGLLLWGFFFMGVAFLLHEFVRENRGTRFLAYIGKISYSMYLTQFAVLHWLERFNLLDTVGLSGPWRPILNFGLRYSLVCAATVLVSSLTYKFVEKPFIAFGNSLIKRREGLSA